MIFRLIGFIVVFGIFLLFIVLNLDNRSDISFGLVKIQEVPVFLTIFISFMAGMLGALPFVFGFRARKKDKVVRAEGKPGKKSGKAGENSSFGSEDPNLNDRNQYGVD